MSTVRDRGKKSARFLQAVTGYALIDYDSDTRSVVIPGVVDLSVYTNRFTTKPMEIAQEGQVVIMAAGLAAKPDEDGRFRRLDPALMSRYLVISPMPHYAELLRSHVELNVIPRGRERE